MTEFAAIRVPASPVLAPHQRGGGVISAKTAPHISGHRLATLQLHFDRRSVLSRVQRWGSSRCAGAIAARAELAAITMELMKMEQSK